MALSKVNYVDNQTIITAQNLNDIQDEIIQNTKLIKNVAPRNLLDNSYWDNPNAVINERKNTYVTGKGTYPIDRWQYSYDGDTVRGGAGYDSTHKYLYLINNSSNEGNTMLYQNIPMENLSPGKYTFALRDAGTNLSTSMLAYINGGILKYTTASPNADGIMLMTFEITEVQTYLTIYIYAGPNKTLLFDWAALYEGEYTAETLPNYIPKGYAAELAECQRYYVRIDAGGNYTAIGIGHVNMTNQVVGAIALPQVMRLTHPSINLNGTLTFRSANLYYDVAAVFLNSGGVGTISLWLDFAGINVLTPGCGGDIFIHPNDYLEISADL